MAVDGQRFMTKTQHYRKVTKPLLERKRRARMNLYLDELKDLIVDTMEAQGEHVTKLEKADILELTVNYLKSHKHEITSATRSGDSIATGHDGHVHGQGQGQSNGLNVEKFRAGYTQAAYEVSKVFSTIPGLDLQFGTRLMKHLGYQLKDIKQAQRNLTAHGNIAEFAPLTGTPPPDGNHLQERRHLQQNDDENEICDELIVHGQPKTEYVWRPW